MRGSLKTSSFRRTEFVARTQGLYDCNLLMVLNYEGVSLLSSSGKAFRLSEFIDPKDGKAVIIAADRGLMLGPIAGLADLEKTIRMAVNSKVDAVVLSPGQVGRMIHHFKGRKAPALLVRADWTNAFRGESFILPAREVKRVTVIDAEDAVALGASAVIAFFCVGYEEDEAHNLESVAVLARSCDRLGMPLIVESIPIGERVTETNFVDCVDLAVRMAVEVGADAIAAPYTGDVKSFRKIIEAAKVPVFALDTEVSPVQDLLRAATEALEAGAAGVIASNGVFQATNPVVTVETLVGIIHRKE